MRNSLRSTPGSPAPTLFQSIRARQVFPLHSMLLPQTSPWTKTVSPRGLSIALIRSSASCSRGSSGCRSSPVKRHQPATRSGHIARRRPRAGRCLRKPGTRSPSASPGQVLPRLERNGVHPGIRGPRFPQALGRDLRRQGAASGQGGFQRHRRPGLTTGEITGTPANPPHLTIADGIPTPPCSTPLTLRGSGAL